MMDRWFRIYQSILDWQWHDDPMMVSFWIHIISLAKFKDCKYRGIELKRGELATNYDDLAELVGITNRQVRTCVERLVKDGSILKKTASKKVVITICNYDYYQQSDETKWHDDGTMTAQSSHDNGNITADYINKNDRKKEERKNYPTDSKKESSPRFQKPSIIEIAAYCQLRDNGIEAQHFYDYYESVGWKVGNKPMKDWQAAVRTWEINHRPQKPQQEKPKKKWQT